MVAPIFTRVRIKFDGGGLLSGHWLDSEAPADKKSVEAIMFATRDGQLHARCRVGDDELPWLPKRKPRDVRQYWFEIAERKERPPTLLLLIKEVDGPA